MKNLGFGYDRPQSLSWRPTDYSNENIEGEPLDCFKEKKKKAKLRVVKDAAGIARTP
jgi:hypothetical protein